MHGISGELTLEAISHTFGNGPKVLHDVSLNVSSGEFVSFIGPSGCGKTSLLRIIASLIQPSEGRVFYGNSPESAKNSVIPETAFIFQDATLLPWADVLANIELPLRLRGVNVENRRATAQELAENLGLRHAMRQFPRELSGGMQMRVSLARALTLNPQIMLLDEPFGALDAITRNRLNEDFLKLHAKHGWTAFFVTHSVTEAVFLSNRIFVMGHHPGRIVSEIPVNLAYPRTQATRESLEFQSLVAQTSAQLHKALHLGHEG